MYAWNKVYIATIRVVMYALECDINVNGRDVLRVVICMLGTMYDK